MDGDLDTLTPLGEGIWSLAFEQRLGILDFGSRMTIVRLPSGQLWLHAPFALSDAHVAAIRELGEVGFLVAPNMFHHLHFHDAMQRFPDATALIAPGLAAKVSQLDSLPELPVEPHAAWTEVLDQVRIEGMPKLNETVFLHRSSRTLILTDLSFNFGHEPRWLTRQLKKALRIHNRFGLSRYGQSMLKDQAAFDRSLRQVLAWDFDRISVCHGQMIDSGGAAIFRDAFAG